MKISEGIIFVIRLIFHVKNKFASIYPIETNSHFGVMIRSLHFTSFTRVQLFSSHFFFNYN